MVRCRGKTCVSRKSGFMKCSEPRGLLIRGNSQAEVGDPGAKCWPVPFPSHGARLGAALGAWGPPGPSRAVSRPLCRQGDLWTSFWWGPAPTPPLNNVK